jgi:hypothetical protein
MVGGTRSWHRSKEQIMTSNKLNTNDMKWTPSHGVAAASAVALAAAVTLAASPVAADNAGAVHLQRLSVKDPGINNEEAFSMLVPAGWQSQGGIHWEPNLSNLASAQMRIFNPNGPEMLELYPIFPYTWTQQGIFGFPRGSVYLGNYVQPPVEPAQYIQQAVLPNFRKGVQPRIVGRERLPDVERATAATVQEQGVQKQVLAERVRVEYALNGQPMEEDFYCVMVYATSQMLPGTTFWQANRLYSFRAAKGQLDAQVALLHTMVSSVRIGLKWFNGYMYVVQLWQQRQYAAIRQAGELSRHIAKNNEEISDMIRGSYENQQRAYDRVNDNFSKYIRGVERYNQPFDGKPVELPSGYDNAWVSSSGEYVLSNDAGYNPNVGSTAEWRRMKATQ